MELTVARRAYALGGLVALVLGAVFPAGRPVVVGLVGALALGAIGVGSHELRPPRRAGWVLLMVALLLFTPAAALTTAGLGRGTTVGHFPGPADILFLIACLPLALGLLELGRPRSLRRDRLLVLDTVAMGVAVSLAFWILVVRPAVATLELTGAAKVVAVMSWVALVAVTVAALRVAVVWRTNVALNLVTLACLVFLATDLAYAHTLVDGRRSGVVAIDLGYAAFGLLIGAAGLIPSMASLRSDELPSLSYGPARLVTIAAGLLVVPTVLVIESADGDARGAIVIGLAGLVVGLIMLVRVLLAAQYYRRRGVREQVMAEATRGLVRAATAEQVWSTLRGAFTALVPRGRLTTPARARAPGLVTLDSSGRQVAFDAPVADLEELWPSLGALADQAGAALDRIDLTQQVMADQRERYFRTLVLTSSEVTLISRAGRVSYATPSAQSMFGRAVVGAPVAEVLPGLSGQSSPADLRVRRPDGSHVDVVAQQRDLTHDPTVGGVVTTLRDVTVERRLRDDLAFRASHDPLTGLANAATFNEILRDSTQDSRAVLFIDIDDFKAINDTYGHPVGDQFLVATAGRIDASLSPADVAARLGGDEFAALLRGVPDERSASTVAQRIIDSLAEPVPVAGRGIEGHVSVGVAYASHGGTRDDAQALLRRADVALYAAKAAGKGQWRTFPPPPSSPPPSSPPPSSPPPPPSPPPSPPLASS